MTVSIGQLLEKDNTKVLVQDVSQTNTYSLIKRKDAEIYYGGGRPMGVTIRLVLSDQTVLMKRCGEVKILSLADAMKEAGIKGERNGRASKRGERNANHRRRNQR